MIDKNLAVHFPQGFLSGKKHGFGIIPEPMLARYRLTMNESKPNDENQGQYSIFHDFSALSITAFHTKQ
ncbi:MULTISPECIES: hypothetical protein [Bacillus]|uniref:hypothetical protein n=1 Tax=Bacillus TaxID=1386 RepID=UPI00168AAB22|nr:MULTISPECIES: hypothetical protein [Bacillus amyloliquefaciens group]MCW5195556.1 hypothetical protein [Bacillus amyloliquefaciens]QOC79993.1 hypothetical protein ID168_01255 [Bacillus velezensis]QYM56930.1 hypothetical protein KNV92_01255 [Bacillus velezensis]WKD94926.1 hypothetical protein QY487_01260 [Bacillus velezensis]